MTKRAWAWRMCVLFGVVAGCEPSGGCVDGCEPPDDPTTPGDDRPGYVWCEEPLGAAVTCPPDTLCCLTGPSCATREQGCQDPFNVATCDGPEDCSGVGERCQTASHDRACRADGILTYCHTDADCASLPGLPNGVCTPNGVCDFTVN